MTRNEFNELTKLNYSEEKYAPVENMYMRAGDMDKATFCKDWKQHKDSELLHHLFAVHANMA